MKLHFAVRHLATGKGTLKDRLIRSISDHLIHLKLAPDSSESHAELASALEMATRKADPYGKIGTLGVTIRTNGWQADQAIAKKIFRAYELERAILET